MRKALLLPSSYAAHQSIRTARRITATPFEFERGQASGGVLEDSSRSGTMVAVRSSLRAAVMAMSRSRVAYW